MRRACLVAAAAIAAWLPAAAASASNWPVPLGAASRGEAQAFVLPKAGTVSDACAPSGPKLVVTWSGPAHVVYDIYQAADTTNGPWTMLTNAYPNTSFTTPSLPSGHTHYYEVQPSYSLSNWKGPMSAPSTQMHRIVGNNCL